MAIKGKGTKFYHGTSSADTLLAGVRSITPPGPEVADIDTTDLQSDAKTFLAGIPDFGEAEMTLFYDKTQHAALVGLVGDDQKFKVLYSDGSSDSFDGYIKGLKGEAIEVDGVVTQTVTVKVSGVVTPAAGA